MERDLKCFEVTINAYQSQIELGHVGYLSSYPRYGLTTGFIGTVAAWSEVPYRRQTTVTMIGWAL
jgi:hypothetical protein